MIATLILGVWALAPAASAANVDFTCTPDEGAGIVDLPPLEVQCVVNPPADGTWSETTWTFGDGGTAVGDTVTYQYEDAGQFNVSVLLEGFEDAAAPEAEAPFEMKYGYVTLCGPPEPAFSITNKGGLDLQMVNTTTISVHCLDTLTWEIYEGRGRDSRPIFTFEMWEPRFELPAEGRYTFALTLEGIGGKRAAKVPLNARLSLTDDLKNAPRAYFCQTGPVPTGVSGLAGLALLALAAVRRRA